MSGKHASTGHASTGHASTGHASTGHASTGHASTEPASTGHASTGHASTEPASTGHASTGHASTGDASTEPTAGGESEGGGVKGGWLSNIAQKGTDWAKGKAQDKATEFAKEKAKEAIFGKPAENSGSDPSGSGPSGSGPSGTGPSSTMMRPPVPYGPPSSSGGDAYGWVNAACPAPMAPLTPAQRPSQGGLTGWLDDNVEHALKASGLMDYLEKVTGNLDELNAAAEEWQAQAKAAQNVAEQLRAECQPLAQSWQGDASDAFGRHMGEVVEALDSTADGMYQTAQIINQAAQMCAMAEGMVIEIISEAIEALIASLAVEAVVAVLTLGIGLIADAMLDAAEIAAFVARVAKVSEELAQNLEKLLKALKELGAALKAVRSLKDARAALKAVKEVKTALNGLREMENAEKSGKDLLQAGKDAWKNKSLDGLGEKAGDFAARKAAGWADQHATSWIQGEVKQHVFGDDEGDSVDTSGGFHTGTNKEGKITVGASAWATAKSFGAAAGKSALGVAKGDWEDPTDKGLITGSIEGEVGYDLGRSGVGQQIAGSSFVQGADHLAKDLPFGLGDKLEGAVTGNEYVKGVTENESDPAPYRVDKSRIENAFG